MINERIKQIRKSAHLTQDKFGESLGVSDAAISKLESGINTPSDALVKLICAIYHINYPWLKNGIGPMREAMDTDDLVEKYTQGESEVTKAILKAFAKMPDEEWEKLRDLIVRIKEEGRR